MENKPSEAAVQVSDAVTPREQDAQHMRHRSRRKRGPMHLVKAALYMVRSRPQKSKGTEVDDDSKNRWGKLVGSVRPFHLQEPSPTLSPENELPQPKPLQSPPEYSDDALLSPSASSACSGPESRYASAEGLDEMIQPDDDQKEEGSDGEEGEGDNMIDAKAEEFIANFYQQMQLQSVNSRTKKVLH